MRKNAQTKSLTFMNFCKYAGINAFEGALFGAFLGSVISVIVASVVWYLKAGLFMGLPTSQDIAFSLGMGLWEGAAVGAALTLVEFARNKNLYLNSLPPDQP